MKLPELKLKEAVQVGTLPESLLVLSASAGSGKTFSLVTFMLGFLGQGSVRPHQLMAMSYTCLLYTSPSPRDRTRSRMPSSA